METQLDVITGQTEFFSSGTRCRGIIYFPDEVSTDLPCVVLANGLSGTMDWHLPGYAEEFAKNGFAAFIFDYRFFGQSGGAPRQLVDIHEQRKDIHAAVAHVRGLPRINGKKIILWGTSLGGGHVLSVAVADPSICAIIAQVPAFDMVRSEARATIKLPARHILRIMAAAAIDGMRASFRMAPHYIKVFSADESLGIFTDPSLAENFNRVEKTSRYWQNRITPRFYLKPPRFKRKEAAGLKVPALICIARHEVYANPAFQKKVGLMLKRGMVKEYNATHFDFYHGMKAEVVSDQVAFLRMVTDSG